MRKKVGIVVIPFIIILIIGICFWQYEKNKKIDAKAIRLKEDLTVEFGESIKISDLIDFYYYYFFFYCKFGWKLSR